MMKKITFKVGVIFLLSVGPSVACDPEEMITELRTQCMDVVGSAAALLEPVKSHLTAAERNSLEAKIKEAGALCNSDRYADGFAVTARVARFIGHVEAHKGIAPVL
jgi:hypothetical protein